MKTLSENDISIAYRLIENADFSLAREGLRELMGFDFSNKEVRFALWCCAFWEGRIKSLEALDYFEKAESLISGWKDFVLEVQRNYEDMNERAVFSVKVGIFTLALKFYENLFEEKDDVQRAEIFRKAGLCYKKLGSFERALEFLDEANFLKPGDPAIIAERGDCFALTGNEKNARILLKEAFFINPLKIDLDFLDSELICALIRAVEEKGYSGKTLNEWVPVYGILYGVFNMKRPLRSQEVGRLRQDIYALENELKDPASPSELLVPRLINLYFWLIEYYVSENDTSGKINDVLIKIKLQDESIYRQYIK